MPKFFKRKIITGLLATLMVTAISIPAAEAQPVPEWKWCPSFMPREFC